MMYNDLSKLGVERQISSEQEKSADASKSFWLKRYFDITNTK